LAPNLNIARTPVSGRTFEMFGEDPYLIGLSGAAWVRGLQSMGIGA
jgi:beta-glucosidase